MESARGGAAFRRVPKPSHRASEDLATCVGVVSAMAPYGRVTGSDRFRMDLLSPDGIVARISCHGFRESGAVVVESSFDNPPDANAGLLAWASEHINGGRGARASTSGCFEKALSIVSRRGTLRPGIRIGTVSFRSSAGSGRADAKGTVESTSPGWEDAARRLVCDHDSDVERMVMERFGVGSGSVHMAEQEDQRPSGGSRLFRRRELLRSSTDYLGDLMGRCSIVDAERYTTNADAEVRSPS